MYINQNLYDSCSNNNNLLYCISSSSNCNYLLCIGCVIGSCPYGTMDGFTCMLPRLALLECSMLSVVCMESCPSVLVSVSSNYK